MKAFDQIGNVTTPDEDFNKKSEQIDKKIKDQISEIEKEQLETNKGLLIEMRNQSMCPIMRVEFPSEITQEIKELKDDSEELKEILKKVAKTYLKKAYNLEKKVDITSTQSYDTGMGSIQHYEDKIKIIMFLDNVGSADLTWGGMENFGHGHDLYPKIFDNIPAEKGVLLIMPSYVKMNTVKCEDYKLWGVRW